MSTWSTPPTDYTGPDRRRRRPGPVRRLIVRLYAARRRERLHARTRPLVRLIRRGRQWLANERAWHRMEGTAVPRRIIAWRLLVIAALVVTVALMLWRPL